MTRVLVLAFALVTALVAAPNIAQGSPQGSDTNPLGTLRWLPDNANEKAGLASGVDRLVLVYDFSRDAATGAAKPLIANGGFGLKVFTPSLADFRMVGHSASVSTVKDLTGQDQFDSLDQVFVGVSGDTRDGACSKLGTPAFSAAYSTTRTFFFSGTTPYQATNSAGACERVDGSIPTTGGFTTTVTTFAPGFWIDVNWPKRSVSAPVIGSLYDGRVEADVFYGALYDTGGESGEFPQTADANGTSTSVGSPGDYTSTFTLSAHPGAGNGSGDPCSSLGGSSADGSWQDLKVSVPAGATKVTFKLFPHGDWDLVVDNQDGLRATSGYLLGGEETIVLTANGAGQVNKGTIPLLEPGTDYTLRGCNATGETSVMGALIIK
ncbi:MAG: hypothetical protein ABR600_12720 [Actinomycetota bacterium]